MRPKSFATTLLACALMLPLAAEPPRAPEVFGTIGSMRAGDDEGSLGAGLAYGGAVTIPFANRWAVDVQTVASRISDSPDYRLNRLLFAPAVHYRRGHQKALWFIGLGPGIQHDRIRSTFNVLQPGSIRSTTVTVNGTDTGLTLHWRTGGVFEPTGRLLVRGEFFWANRYVLPNVGVAISLGIRLGR